MITESRPNPSPNTFTVKILKSQLSTFNVDFTQDRFPQLILPSTTLRFSPGYGTEYYLVPHNNT